MTVDRHTFDKLEASIEEHLERLRTERERFRELVEDIDVEKGPDEWLIVEAVANRLHNFYMGAEHIFERIAKLVDGDVPSGRRWHKDLLDRMKDAGDVRPPVVDEKLHSALLGFLQFRHFYREGYLVDVEWSEMTGLIDTYEQTLSDTIDSMEKCLEDIRPS